MSAINVGEVYYFLRKKSGVVAAHKWRELSGTLPVMIDIPAAGAIWSAAEIKGRFPISYADAFAAELGQRHGCAVITGDPEFRSVAGLELDWVGR
jgi:ribonuclease VapC